MICEENLKKNYISDSLRYDKCRLSDIKYYYGKKSEAVLLIFETILIFFIYLYFVKARAMKLHLPRVEKSPFFLTSPPTKVNNLGNPGLLRC